MAVVIRLSRVGATHQTKYRVTVADSRRAVKNGKYLEVVGYYNPEASGKDKALELNMDKVNAWIKNGAQPTDRVRTLIKQATGTAPTAKA